MRSLLPLKANGGRDLSGRNDNNREARYLGDLCRAQGFWDQAAQHYREYLSANPEDFAISVQLGNCLKEAGAYTDALEAYDRAIALNEQDADVLLQKGHLLKLSGRRYAAIQQYQSSLHLQPRQNDALLELLMLGATDELTDVIDEANCDLAQVRTIYLDVSDLIEYARHNSTWSGIQRVTSNLVLNTGAVTASSGQLIRIVLAVPDYVLLQVFEVNASLVTGLIGAINSGVGDRPKIARLIALLQRTRRQISPSRGDVFLLPGAFWTYDNYDMLSLLRERGVYFSVFIHDLIQIKNPEYVHKTATVIFRERLIDVLTIADLVLTSSEFVAGEVRDFMASRLNFTVPVQPIALAAEFATPRRVGSYLSREIVELCGDEFVLCVCTIEIRKNHWYLVRIWERLRREFSGKIPNLVFVGKWGWDIEQFRHYLEDSDYLDNWLFVLNEVSDAELDHLYDHCLFTVYASFAEGWGLPVGESLAHGKPCIASGVTSIPEVGAELARYVDPHDLADGYRAVEGLLSRRSELAEWTERVRAEFHPRRWADFCTDFLDAVTALGRDGSAGLADNNCTLPSGELILGGGDDIARLDEEGSRLISFRMARRSGWHPVEGWGVWASRRRARLSFRTELDEDEPIKLSLLLRSPSDSERAKCTIRVGDVEITVADLPDQEMLVQIDAKVGAAGRIDIDLVSAGRSPDLGDRKIYVGLIGLGFCRSDDLAGRVDLLEKITCRQSRRRAAPALPGGYHRDAAESGTGTAVGPAEEDYSAW